MPLQVFAEEQEILSVAQEENTETGEENDDPGKARLQGYIPEEFYGTATYTRSSDIQHASKFDDYTIENGIDVSYYNGDIDWAKVEANFVLNKISGYDITLPVVLDFEYANDMDGNLIGRLYNANLSKDKATKVCLAFCETVENAGYTPMVYANKDMLMNHLNASEISASYPIWLAHYTNATDYEGEYNYWQYSASGQVDGISGNVDLDFRYVKKGAEDTGSLELSTEATMPEPTYTSYKTTTDVNYRSGPGTSYAVKGTLALGKTISVENGYSKSANGYTWYRFKMNSKTYYIASKYLKKI